MKLRSLFRISKRTTGVIIPVIASIFMSAAVIGCSSTDGAGEPEAALEETTDGAAEGNNSAAKNNQVNFEEGGNAAAQPTAEQANAAASNELQSLMNDSGAANQPLPTDSANANGSLNSGEAGSDPFNANAAPAAPVTDAAAAAPEQVPAAVPTQDPFAASADQQSPAVADSATPGAEPTAASAPAAQDSHTASAPTVGVLPENGAKLPYHIQRGDTLASIAGKIFGNASRWKDLARENNLQDPSLIYAGDVILYSLNDKSRGFAEKYESSSRKKVVVAKGDTLSKISFNVYGTQSHWRSIWKDNPQVKNPDVIVPGMVLMVRVSDSNGVAQDAPSSESRKEEPSEKPIEEAALVNP